jgi:molybdenum cofactor cytidylyltransferase
LLLAAGRSARFGIADKICVSLGSLPLGHHAARALAPLPLSPQIVVTGRSMLDWPGMEVIINDHPEKGMAHSIALGLGAVRRSGAEAVLIALADMPLVPTEHFQRLLACHRGPAALAASSDGARRMPPALFGADWFAELDRLSGDQGARTLLDGAELATTAPDNLLDVDRPADLARAQAILDR